jgi:16S rRNA (guanine527-N7)-methyltransferase
MNPLWPKLAPDASHAQLVLLQSFLDKLLGANEFLNLTRITNPAQAQVLHIADSLTLLPHIPTSIKSIADIGSGGGVPGIPLAILFPDIPVALIESTRKKADFMRDVASEMKLKNITVIPDRAENLHKNPKARYDLITARAVAPLADLIQWCVPLLRENGRLIAMKGLKADTELSESAELIKKFRLSTKKHSPPPLPGADHHVLIEFIKL